MRLNLPRISPKNTHVISTTLHPLSITQNNSRRNMNLIVNNFLNDFLRITTSKIYWSPEARFLIACSNNTIYFQHLTKDPKRLYPSHTRKSWTHIASFFLLITSGVRCKFIFSPPRKGSWITGFEIWFANHSTTNITFNVIKLKHCIPNI